VRETNDQGGISWRWARQMIRQIFAYAYKGIQLHIVNSQAGDLPNALFARMFERLLTV
jgi:hypothetical protein